MILSMSKYIRMSTAGGKISTSPLSYEQASRIRKRQSIVNKGTLYTAGAAVLTLVAESIYRNLGGDPVTANYIFQAGGYTLLGTGIVAFLNNQERVIDLETRENKGILETKLEE